MSQTHTLTADDYGVLANADAAADGWARLLALFDERLKA